MKLFVFIEAKKGTSEKGNPYQVVKLVKILDENCKEIVLREFFCDPKKNFSTLRFGDVVEPVFVSVGDFGEKQQLDKIILVSESPYLEMLTEEDG